MFHVQLLPPLIWMLRWTSSLPLVWSLSKSARKSQQPGVRSKLCVPPDRITLLPRRSEPQLESEHAEALIEYTDCDPLLTTSSWAAPEETLPEEPGR